MFICDTQRDKQTMHIATIEVPQSPFIILAIYTLYKLVTHSANNSASVSVTILQTSAGEEYGEKPRAPPSAAE